MNLTTLLKQEMEEFDEKYCRTNRQTGEKMDKWFFPEELTPFEIKSWITSHDRKLLEAVKDYIGKLPSKWPSRESDEYDLGYNAAKSDISAEITKTLNERK